jgi:hypothetical protein
MPQSLRTLAREFLEAGEALRAALDASEPKARKHTAGPPMFVIFQGSAFWGIDGTLVCSALLDDDAPDWDDYSEVENWEESPDEMRAIARLFDCRVPSGYTWRLTGAGAWVYMNKEGADVGHAYALPSGVFRGEAWGREKRNFERMEDAKAWVVQSLA